MKAASQAEIKKALKEKDHNELVEFCLRFSRFKKENKELLTYLLFEEAYPEDFLKAVREMIDEGFAALNKNSMYFAKKGLRKILRQSNKYIRYTGSREMEVEILIHYATSFNGLSLPWKKSPALVNLYNGVLKKIDKTISGFHEDLQYDYRRNLQRLTL